MRKVVWFRTSTVFWLGGGTISQLLNVHGVHDIRQTEIRTAEPLVPDSSAFETKIATGKVKRHKSPVIDQIPAKFFKIGSRTILFQVSKLSYIWDKKELRGEWKELIIARVCKKGNKMEYSNYRGISFLSTT
jgi:hypothetical protein